MSNRTCWAAVVIIVLAGCSPPPRPPRPPAPATSTPSQPNAVAPTLAEALEALRTAEVFEDVHVGVGGGVSASVAAFRIVLADVDASASFHALVDGGTPAGRLYGAAGIYLADPSAFDAAIARIAAAGGDVPTQSGCLRRVESVASILRTSKAPRIEVAKGTTLAAAMAVHPNGGHCDLAGGCVPLMFAGDGRPAPR